MKSKTALLAVTSILCIAIAPTSAKRKVQCGKPPIRPMVAVTSEGKLAPSETRRQGTDRIIGGDLSVPHSIPWQVRIYVARAPVAGFFCGGALLTRKWAITAAHCYETAYTADGAEKHGQIAVAVGYHDSVKEDSVQTCALNASHWLLHPNASADVPPSDYVDAALIDTAHCRFTYSRAVQPVCLPQPTDDYRTAVGSHVLVSGWGDTDADTAIQRNSPALQQTVVPIKDWAQCKAAYDGVQAQYKADPKARRMFIVGEGHLCSSGDDKDSCQGDSGGPAVVLQGGRFTLAGLVHSGFNCADAKYPGIYLHMPHVVPWIKQIVRGSTARNGVKPVLRNQWSGDWRATSRSVIIMHARSVTDG